MDANAPLHIYTDASLNEGVGGIAAVYIGSRPEGTEPRPLMITCRPFESKSIVVAELSAILLALEDIPAPGSTVCIFSDSKNAIDLLNGLSRHVPYNQAQKKKQILARIENRSLTVSFQYIPRAENGVADALSFMGYTQNMSHVWIGD